MVDLSGKQLGPYKVETLIGKGGMAAVYKAFHEATDRHVAIKVMLPDIATDDTFKRRFEREAKTLAGLQHVHILPVFDYGQQDDMNYLVMPYLTGKTLADRIENNPLSLQEISVLFRQIASALDYAHGKDIIHRDLKPENIMLDDSGNPLLADFGLTKLLGDSKVSKLTSDSTIIGTPVYMSPEQGQGLELDTRSDLYSISVVLYEMLTGDLPFKADTPVSVIFKHISDPLPPPSLHRDDLPDGIDDVLTKALAKQPDDRFQSAAEIADALDAAMEGRTRNFDLPKPKGKPKDGEMSTTQADKLAVVEAGYMADTETIVERIDTETNQEKRKVPAIVSVIAGSAVVVLVSMAIGVGVFRLGLPASGDNTFYRSPDDSFEAHSEAITDLDISTNGELLLTGSDDNTVKIWSDDYEELIQVEGTSSDVASADLHPNGTQFVLNGDDGNGFIWSIEDNEKLITMLDGGKPIHRYSPDGRLLASINGLTLTVVWSQNPAENEARQNLFMNSEHGMETLAALPVTLNNPAEARYTSFAFTPAYEVIGETEDGRDITRYEILLGDEAGNLYLGAVDFEEPFADPATVPDDFAFMDENSQPSYFYLSGEVLYKTQNVEAGSTITDIEISPDGERFATANDNGLVVVWEFGVADAVFDQIRILPGADWGGVTDLSFSPDGAVLAMATANVDALLYDVDSSQVLGELFTDGGDANAVAFTPDATLLVGADDGHIYEWYFESDLAELAEMKTE